jgi:serine/threonine protein kinase
MQPAAKANILRQSNNKNQDFREVYSVGKKLGEGTFGMVFECTKKTGNDNVVYAVKMLEHQSGWWGQMSRSNAVQWEVFAQEFEMLKRMSHTNVINLKDVFADTHFLYFIMDKYENSLIAAALPALQKGKKFIPSACIGEITAQMLASIVYLHDQKIVHRDVKADNFLVDIPQGGSFKGRAFTVVLTDLSTARYLEDGVFLKEMLGTMQYWAPEIIARYYTHKVDCWAIGVILWCMLTLKFPFNTVQETYTKKLTFRPDKMNNDQFDCVTQLLEKNPAKRASAREGYDHKWVREASAKHAQMVAKSGGADEEAEQDAGQGSQDLNDAGEMGFGDIKKDIDADVKERRQRNMEDTKNRFDRGERDAVRIQDKVAQQQQAGAGTQGGDDGVLAKDKQRAGEAKNYNWWSEERCREKNVPDVNTDCTVAAANTNNEDPGAEMAGDQVLTEPADVKELTEKLAKLRVATDQYGKGQAKTLEELFGELEKQECRMVLRGGEIVRIVDILALRIRTPKSKLLVAAEKNELPSVQRQAGGSGVDKCKAEVKRLLKMELGTTDDVIEVSVKVSDPQQEQLSFKQPAPAYPGLTTVYRKTFFDATVNMGAARSDLTKLGLPDETNFQSSSSGLTTNFKWATAEELSRDKVVVSAPRRLLADLEGFRPLLEGSTTEAKLTEEFTKHKIDISKFGVGSARTMAQFVQETNTGETRLYSNGKEIRRQLELLIVKIRNPVGAYLVETGHSFGGQSRQKNAFPATKIRPFEDKVWAVRRLLGEVDIPYSSSTIIFGPRRVEMSESPSYPGVTTVYAKQVVEVRLDQIDVANLGGADMGAGKWNAR